MAKPYVVTHSPEVPINAPEQTLDFKDKGDVAREVYYTYSLVPDVFYPWDPAVLRSIRVNDPGFIPATVKRIVRTPAGSDVPFFYFAALRRVDMPNGFHAPITVNMPWAAGTRAQPNIEELVFEDEATQQQQKQGWPGPFIPMASDVALRVRRAGWLSDRYNRDIYNEMVREQSEREAKTKAKIQAEHDYRWDQEAAYLRTKDKPSDSEIAQIGVPRERERKPFVLLGHTLPNKES